MQQNGACLRNISLLIGLPYDRQDAQGSTPFVTHDAYVELFMPRRSRVRLHVFEGDEILSSLRSSFWSITVVTRDADRRDVNFLQFRQKLTSRNQRQTNMKPNTQPTMGSHCFLLRQNGHNGPLKGEALTVTWLNICCHADTSFSSSFGTNRH